MGLMAVVSSTTKGMSAAAARSVPVGLAAGGIFVAIALVVVLVYLDLLDASPIENGSLRRLLLATIVPLLVTFVVIVLYQSATVL